uniref:Uncharacterized protein n=1 Tax=Setaria viridis TaxID=4556 RepID=A0A4U6SQK2_SETVI|nr:hypothetical protein SEVIR_9G052700v2 [Setaria viridis]
MGRKSAPIGSWYGHVCEELLEIGARVAVQSYGHCTQTGRMYYKPPSTPATANSNRNGEEAASGGVGAAAATARGSSSRRRPSYVEGGDHIQHVVEGGDHIQRVGEVREDVAEHARPHPAANVGEAWEDVAEHDHI